ncbi:MAG: ScpA family protein, partial [Paracoccaceae bacterium]|nr:ScpA family protein [Paracoccaceae bacterium]
LNLSRAQKVDLRKISLVDLCDQYLNFISEAKKLKIEIAADYLIMASWLVFLKSELLLPKSKFDEENNFDELAENLKFQLIRLDAMRKVSVKLMSSDQLNRDFFKRGEKEDFKSSKKVVYTSSLLDMLQAYAGLKTKEDFKPLHLKRLFVFTPEEALEIMNEKLRLSIDWQTLDKFVPKLWRQEPQKRRAAIATSFAVSLEQARLKRVEIMQAEMFAPLYLRKVDQF